MYSFRTGELLQVDMKECMGSGILIRLERERYDKDEQLSYS